MQIKILQFYKESQISRILRYTRYTLLAIFGHREAELTARELYRDLDSKETHPILRILFDALYDRLNYQEWHQKRLYPYLKNIKKEGLVFEEDHNDPAVIAQIKKIINLLQLAEEVLLTVEKMGDDRSLSALFQEVDFIETTDKIYELCQLLIWPDIDLLSEFHEEYQWAQALLEPLIFTLFNPDLLSSLAEMGVTHGARWAHRAGHHLGHGVLHLERPLNYHFFMDLKKQLAQYAEIWVTHFQTKTSFLDAEKQHAYSLESRLLVLLSSLEHFSRKKILRVGSFTDLSRVLKHGHDILWKLCYEINHLESPNQLWVKEMLEGFRLEFCLPLLSFLDKCEEKLVLTPGGLTNITQAHLESLFDAMTVSLKRFVFLNEEERVLVNSVFMEKRLMPLYERRARLHLHETKSRLFLMAINEDILHHIYERQRLFRRPGPILSFSSDYSPKTSGVKVSVSEYFDYLTHYEIFLQAKNAYIKFTLYKKTGYTHYDSQLRRGLFEQMRSVLPDKYLSLDAVMTHQTDIEKLITLEEGKFAAGLDYYRANVAPSSSHEKNSPMKQVKHFLSEMADTFLEKYQSLSSFFNEETQALLKPDEGDFLTNLGHAMTFSVMKLPYPEVSDAKVVLAEPHALVWIKRLANIVTHLSKAGQQCRHFDNTVRSSQLSGIAYQRAKALCLANVVIVEHHARHALRLMLDLSQDNYLHDFYQERLNGVTQLYQMTMQAIPHQSIDEIKPLIQQASSLFEKLHPQVSWFLHLPHVLDLLIALKALLYDTYAENPEVIQKKLKEIQSILVSIQIEADASEELLLLKEGVITAPLDQILSHYHQGFLRCHPCLLHASLEMTDGRLKAVKARMIENDAKIQQWKGQKSVAIACFEKFKHTKATDSKFLAQAVDFLKQANSSCQVAYRECADADEITALFEPKGDTVSINQDLLRQLIDIYLVHCDGVIKGKTLVKHAMLKKNELLEKKWQSEHLRHQSQLSDSSIDELRQAVLRLKRYIALQYRALERTSVTNAFESKETLQKKAAYLKQLEDILENKALSPTSKFTQMQSIVQKPLFKESFLTCHHYDFFSFQWLWQCLCRLLSALSLYTPPYQKVYRDLAQTFHRDEPRRWSFFPSQKDETQNAKERLYSYITTP